MTPPRSTADDFLKLGSKVRVTRDRGTVIPGSDAFPYDALVTLHPSAVLRMRDSERDRELTAQEFGRSSEAQENQVVAARTAVETESVARQVGWLAILRSREQQ